MNKVLLSGRLTQKPEFFQTQAGKEIAKINLATNRSVKKGDEWKEVASYHDVVCFGHIKQLKECLMGDQLIVEGRQEKRSYENKAGVKIYTTETIVEKLEFGLKVERAEKQNKEVSTDEADDIDISQIPF